MAVVLTGDLDDGAAGAVAIDACGGAVIVQDPADSVAPSMPLSAKRAVGNCRVVRLGALGDAIVQSLSTPSKEGVMENDKEPYRTEVRIGLTGVSTPEDLDRIGKRSTLTCPECGGIVWRVGSDAPLRYRCHTGHAFSSEALDAEQKIDLEEALWTAVRRAEERAALALSRAKQAETAGDNLKAYKAREQHDRLTLLEEALRALARDNGAD